MSTWIARCSTAWSFAGSASSRRSDSRIFAALHLLPRDEHPDAEVSGRRERRLGPARPGVSARGGRQRRTGQVCDRQYPLD